MKMQSRNKPEIIKMINRVNESNTTKHLFSFGYKTKCVQYMVIQF